MRLSAFTVMKKVILRYSLLLAIAGTASLSLAACAGGSSQMPLTNNTMTQSDIPRTTSGIATFMIPPVQIYYTAGAGGVQVTSDPLLSTAEPPAPITCSGFPINFAQAITTVVSGGVPHVIVSDTGSNSIVIFPPSPTLNSSCTHFSTNAPAISLAAASGTASTTSSYGVLTSNGGVEVFSLGGAFLQSFGTNATNWQQIGLDSIGHVYLRNSTQVAIFKPGTSGTGNGPLETYDFSQVAGNKVLDVHLDSTDRPHITWIYGPTQTTQVTVFPAKAANDNSGGVLGAGTSTAGSTPAPSGVNSQSLFNDLADNEFFIQFSQDQLEFVDPTGAHAPVTTAPLFILEGITVIHNPGLSTTCAGGCILAP